MKRTMLIVLLALGLMSLASLASAQPTPGIDGRDWREHARIREGVRSGELTRREAFRLRAGQRDIRFMERRAKADGVVTARERAHISAAQLHESRAIWRRKHNARMRVM